MDKELLLGLMELYILENLLIIVSQAKVPINGLIVALMKVK